MDASDVQSYLDTIPQSRRARFDLLRELIRTRHPEAVSLCAIMPTYENGAGWVVIANQELYLSVYTCSAGHIASFKQRHPKIKTGKGCINFRESDPIPRRDLEDVIHSALTSAHA